MSEETNPGIPGQLGQLKRRLQFTGWLQYLPNAAASAVLLVLGGLLMLTPLQWLGLVLVALGILLLLVLLFDLVTVKAGLHPSEPLPEPRLDLDPFDLMRARSSTRSFQSRYLSDEHRAALLASAQRWSDPQAGLAGSPQITFEYVRARLTVWPTVGAREFLVAVAPANYNRLAVINIGRSLQMVVNDATRAGIGTCWIGPGADQSSVVAHLGDSFDPGRDHIVCLCAVGYESAYKPLFIRVMHHLMRKRRPLAELFFSSLDPPTPLPIDEPPYDRFGRTYEVCQWAPSSFNAQPTRCVAITSPTAAPAATGGAAPRELVGFSFLATTDSRYYAPVALGIWCANWELGSRACGIEGTFRPAAGDRVAAATADQDVVHRDVDWMMADPMPLDPT